MNISSGTNGINMQWLQEGTQCDITSGEVILVDNIESTYVIGWSKGNIEIQGHSAMRDDVVTLLVSKYSRQGYVQWIRTYNQVSSPQPVVACLDCDNYVCLSYIEGDSVHVLRIAPYGKKMWDKTIEGQDLTSPLHNLSITADSCVYVGAAFKGTVYTDKVIKGTSFVSKLTAQGQWDWSKSLPGELGKGSLTIIDKMVVISSIDECEVHICTVDKDDFCTNIYVIDNLEFDKLHDLLVDQWMNIIVVGSRPIRCIEEDRCVEAVVISPNNGCRMISCACSINVPNFTSLQAIIVDNDFFFLFREEERTCIYQNQFLWLTFNDQPTVGYPAIVERSCSLYITGSYTINMDVQSYNNYSTIVTIQGHDKPSFYAMKLRLCNQTPCNPPMCC